MAIAIPEPCLHYSLSLPLRYVKQCEVFLLDGRISCEMFASECLPTLIHLARDKVPNVRIAVAKMLKESVLGIGMILPPLAVS